MLAAPRLLVSGSVATACGHQCDPLWRASGAKNDPLMSIAQFLFDDNFLVFATAPAHPSTIGGVGSC
jgi:hypothetical protein